MMCEKCFEIASETSEINFLYDLNLSPVNYDVEETKLI